MLPQVREKKRGESKMNQAFYPADILLPKNGTDMSRWSVIACDQFTSEPEYWEETERIVGEAPSTLRMILPEVYLDGPQEKEKLEEIHRSMDWYLSDDLFDRYENAMIYVERMDSSGKMRAGIMGCIDLAQYDYHKGSDSLVRATEATVEERIPPRIRVRQNAPLELPHIMLLIDDKNRTVIEPCEMYRKEEKLLYDFDLMQGGGHLRGYLLEEKEQRRILEALDALAAGQMTETPGQEISGAADCAASEASERQHNLSALVFAVGDGNHSLASAKAFYEQLKEAYPEKDFSQHPARYALAEIVNLHSPALEFEAIHRIVSQADVDSMMAEMTEKLGLVFEEENVSEHLQKMEIVRDGVRHSAIITKTSSKLTVGSLQNFLDSYQKEHPISMDYIHGADTVLALSKEEGSIGFLLPDMKKEELFPSVKDDGALPRKTFSMGHAQDKRYYTECRKIR